MNKHPNSITALLFILLAYTCCTALVPSIVITELHRDPIGKESEIPGGISHEFVEMANFGSDSFPVEGLYITDGMECDSIVPWKLPIPGHENCIYNTTVLPPGAIALILDRDYATAVEMDRSCAFPISDTTFLFTTTDSDIGNGLAMDDGIVLFKGGCFDAGNLVSRAADSSQMNFELGTKIILSHPGKIPEGHSVVVTSLLFGLPRFGSSNSVTPGWFDLVQNGCFAEWRFGSVSAEQAVVTCSLRCVFPLFPEISTPQWSITTAPPRLPVKIGSGRLNNIDGIYQTVIQLPLDTTLYHFTIHTSLGDSKWNIDISEVWTPRSPIRITEIFPRATPDEPEWIELTNRTAMPITLAGWMLITEGDTTTLPMENVTIGPGRFMVITKDANALQQKYPGLSPVIQPAIWHSFGNYRDTIYLLDKWNRIQDSVFYENKWFDSWENGSLERITIHTDGTKRSSWVLSVHATPGQPGKSVRWRGGDKLSMSIGPLPFSPDGDKNNDHLSITNHIPAGTTAKLEIYGFDGKLYRTIPKIRMERYLWDGTDDRGKPVPIGPFYVVLIAATAKEKRFVRKKGILWR